MNKKKLLYLAFMVLMSICAFLGTRGGKDGFVNAEVSYKTNIGQAHIFFTDNKTSVNLEGETLAAYEYTGQGIIPQIEVYDGDKILAKDTNYTVELENNVDVGSKGVIAVKGIGNYNGTKYGEFIITKANLQNMNMSFYGGNSTFVIPEGETGVSSDTIINSVMIENSIGRTLNPKTDYDIVCTGNDQAGTGTVTATGKGDNYEGSQSLNFTVIKASDVVIEEDEEVKAIKSFSPELTKVTLYREKDGEEIFDSCLMEVTKNKYTNSTANWENLVLIKDPYVYKTIQNGNATACIMGEETVNDVKYGILSIMTSSNSTLAKEALYYGDNEFPAAGETVWVGTQQLINHNGDWIATGISNLIEVKIPEVGNKTVALYEPGSSEESNSTIIVDPVENKTDVFEPVEPVEPVIPVEPVKPVVDVSNSTKNVEKDNPKVVDDTSNNTSNNTSQIDISKCNIKLSKTSKAYDGKAFKPTVTVTYDGKKLKQNTDYTVKYDKTKTAGTKKIVISGKGKYKGSVTEKVKIKKAKNPIKVKPTKKTFKASELKNKNKTVSIKATVKEKAKLTFKLSSVTKKGKKYIKFNKKNGKITIKKGIKKGKYVVKYMVTTKGTKNYKNTTVTKKITITIK